MKYRIGIDLGGTNIAVGVCDEEYNIVGRASTKTNLPRPAEEIAADMVKASKEALANAGLTLDDVAAVGIGAPGSIDPENGLIRYANNLGFRNVPMVELVSKGLGKPVSIENDANAAALGEALAGAAKGKKDAVAITLGTGVGGGIIIGGKIYTGFNYAGAELGHIVIEKGGWPCTCGRKGCFEAYSSATGLIKMTLEAMEADKSSKMWEICGGDTKKVGGRTAFDAARAGDKAGQSVVDRFIDYLACGIASIVNIFQPEVLCIGGGVSHEGEYLLAPLRKIVEREQYIPEEVPKTQIVAAKLGNDAGIIGAAYLDA